MEKKKRRRGVLSQCSPRRKWKGKGLKNLCSQRLRHESVWGGKGLEKEKKKKGKRGGGKQQLHE